MSTKTASAYQQQQHNEPQEEVKILYPDHECWVKFVKGCKTPATKSKYQANVAYFMRFLKITDPNALLEGLLERDYEKREAAIARHEKNISDFIQFQKKDRVSGDLITTRKSAIRKFYKRNKVAKLFDWDYFTEEIGEVKRKRGRNSGGGARSREDIAKMRAIADEREKAVLSLYYSSGIRRGVVPGLEVMDLRPIDKYDIFEITAYRGLDEEYRTWCIPEAKHDLEAYFKFRERYGEEIGPHSPVIRDKFDVDDPFGAKCPKHIGENSIFGTLSQLAERAGIRKRVRLVVGQKAGKVRHDVKAVHGLRKFFDTECTNCGVSPLWVEFFEGRQLKGSKGNYYRPSDQQLLEGIDENKMRGYVHCIDALTINEENRLKQKLEIKEQENKKKDELISKYELIQNEFQNVLKKTADQQRQLEELTARMASNSPSAPGGTAPTSTGPAVQP